jgi:Holliday junction resolvase RusA-like endonuclease
MIELFIEGEPVAQGRPRAFRRGNMVGFYDPKESKGWKAEIAKAVKEKTPFPAGIPLILSVKFYLTKPKSVKRLFPTVKPDIDNFVKAVMDALKDVWGDDCQVIQLRASKQYANHGVCAWRPGPGVWIAISEYKE